MNESSLLCSTALYSAARKALHKTCICMISRHEQEFSYFSYTDEGITQSQKS